MPFPETRHTLIQRIVSGGDEEDWRIFMTDYWRPVCRFSMSWGKVNQTDAEDIASLTFEALIRNQLLIRWVSNPSAKLRTLLCGVVRNVLSNRARVQVGRKKLLEKILEDSGGPSWITDTSDESTQQLDLFYAAWVEELLQDCVESVMADYYSRDRGDYFRVLYGRICEKMTVREIADNLGLKQETVENYFKHGRKKLAEQLELMVKERVRRYCTPQNFLSEYQLEWSSLGDYLKSQGGLERAISRSYEALDSMGLRNREQQSVSDILNRLESQNP